MQQIKNSRNLLSLVLLSLLVGVSCTKKRSDKFAQNVGVDAQTVESVKSWRHTLTTGAAKFTPNKSVAEKSMVVSDDMQDILNNFPLVEYTTDSEWLGTDIPIRGRPNFKYELRYEMGDSLIRILKVGLKKDIPSEEWAYAVKLEDGLIGVPLVGYGVEYFNIVHAENENRKSTSTLIEGRVADRRNASHIRINRQSREVFEAVQKVDVYPVDYFKGEWFYQATVVQTTLGNESEITSAGAFDTKLNSAEKVLIKLDNRKTLLGVNANIDKRIDKESTLDQGYVFSIPIEWKEFEARKSGRGQGLSEVDVDRQVEIQRPYVKINFEDHFSPADEMRDDKGGDDKEPSMGFLLRQATGEQKLTDIQFAKDYFSFTLLKSGSGLKIRYAFKRDLKSKYSDIRPYDERDFETFGYFYSVPNLVLTRDYQTKSDVQKNFKMNRFNPDVKEIVYHFSKESPHGDQRGAWVREMGRYAVHFWDQAFQKAGVNIRVRLDESKDVDLGDLRYNVLHIIDPLTYSSLGGLGPSVADPNTGEVVSATANILVSPYTEGAAGAIRKYIRSKLSDKLLKVKDFGKSSDALIQTNEIYLGGQIPLMVNEKGQEEALTLPNIDNGQISKVSVKMRPDQESLLKKYLKVKGMKTNLSEAEKSKAYSMMVGDQAFGMKAAALASGSIYSDGVSGHLNTRIKKECPAVDQFVAKADRNGGEYDSNEEIEIVEDCTRKLSRLSILHVFLHEMGHNFSLAHNFKCSADPGKNRENFWTAAEIRKNFTGLNGEAFPEEFLPQGEDPMSSCVMDYLPDDQALLPVPGKYDIAAIRFVYAGKVETMSGELKPVYRMNKGQKEWMPIRTAVGSQKGVLKPLAYCSDIDAYYSIDPLCRQHDVGLTPEQVVDEEIAAFWTSMSNSTYTYDRINASDLALAPYYRVRRLQNLKRIYDEWRFVVSKYLGPNRGYLESFDQKEYEALLAGMQKSEFKAQYDAYKPARDKIVRFFFQLAFMSDRYCLGTTNSGNLKAMSLSTVIGQVQFDGYDGAIRCTDDGSQAVLKRNNIAFLKDFGQSVENIYFSNSVRALKEAPDVWGSKQDRIFGLLFMGMRLDNSPLHNQQRLYPAMMDEPDVRAQAFGLFGDRMMNGVNVKQYLQGIAQAKDLKDEDTTLRLFKTESDLLKYMADMIRNSLWIPGKLTESMNALSLFAVNIAKTSTDVQSAQKSGAAILQNPSGGVYYAYAQNVVAYNFINKMNAISAELEIKSKGADLVAIKKTTDEISSDFPDAGKALTALSLFKVALKGATFVNDESKDASTRTVVQQTVSPYFGFLQQFSEGKLMEMFQKWATLEGQMTKLQQSAPTVEAASQIEKVKSELVPLETQLAGFDITRFVQSMKLPVNKAAYADEVNGRLNGISRLMDLDIEEIKAHNDVLNTSILNWAH